MIKDDKSKRNNYVGMWTTKWKIYDNKRSLGNWFAVKQKRRRGDRRKASGRSAAVIFALKAIFLWHTLRFQALQN